MMTSCGELDANDIAGTYTGELEIAEGASFTKDVTIKALTDNQAEISLAGIDLGVLGRIDIKATCTVVSIEGAADLAGTTTINFGGFSYNAIPVTGEVEGNTLELSIQIPNYEIEFEGVRKK